MGYKFTIPGRPVPKGRPRLGVKGRRAYVYTPPKTLEYERLVGWVAKASGCRPLGGQLSVELNLFIRGRSGDVDNYCKSILDGLNQIAFQDDDQVVELLVKKHSVTDKLAERVEVELKELGEGS